MLANVRKVKQEGFIKWKGEWYQATSDRIDALIGDYVYIDDPFDGTLDLFTCSWLKKNGKQRVSMGEWICSAK